MATVPGSAGGTRWTQAAPHGLADWLAFCGRHQTQCHALAVRLTALHSMGAEATTEPQTRQRLVLTCKQARTCTCARTRARTHTRAHTHTHARARTHTRARTRTHTYTICEAQHNSAERESSSVGSANRKHVQRQSAPFCRGQARSSPTVRFPHDPVPKDTEPQCTA